MNEDEDDPPIPEAVPVALIPDGTSVPKTPETSSSSKKKRKVSPRENVIRGTLAPSKWQANIAKAALNSGKAHVTPKGRTKRGRSLQPACRKSAENAQGVYFLS